jgi:hypothetical protein
LSAAQASARPCRLQQQQQQQLEHLSWRRQWQLVVQAAAWQLQLMRLQLMRLQQQ